MKQPFIQADYGPDTPEEIVIKQQLMMLQDDYRKLAEPLVRKLTDIHARKLPKYFIMADDS